MTADAAVAFRERSTPDPNETGTLSGASVGRAAGPLTALPRPSRFPEAWRMPIPRSSPAHRFCSCVNWLETTEGITPDRGERGDLLTSWQRRVQTKARQHNPLGPH
jgi:hypothetical protein